MHSKRSIGFIAGLAGAAVGLGTTGFVIGTPPPPPDPQGETWIVDLPDASYTVTTPAPGVVLGAVGQTAKGLTYGPLLDPTQKPPDLIEAIATNGKVGYIRATDYAAVTAAGDPQSVAARPRLTIPVYGKDGTTKIGSFTVAGAADWTEK